MLETFSQALQVFSAACEKGSIPNQDGGTQLYCVSIVGLFCVFLPYLSPPLVTLHPAVSCYVRRLGFFPTASLRCCYSGFFLLPGIWSAHTATVMERHAHPWFFFFFFSQLNNWYGKFKWTLLLTQMPGMDNVLTPLQIQVFVGGGQVGEGEGKTREGRRGGREVDTEREGR